MNITSIKLAHKDGEITISTFYLHCFYIILLVLNKTADGHHMDVFKRITQSPTN